MVGKLKPGTIVWMNISLVFLLTNALSVAGHIQRDEDEIVLQDRIQAQSILIAEMTPQIEAYNDLIIEHKQTKKDMAYIASISPLGNIMTPEEISELLKEIPTGNIFFTPFIMTEPYGISIGYHGEPRTDHRGEDVHPEFPKDDKPMDMRVKPFSGGIVETIGENIVYGKFVIIRHSERVRTFYGHLDKIYYSALPGNDVLSDTVIGLCGNTGMASSDTGGGGKHTHFEIQVWNGDNWVSINPDPFLDGKVG